MDITTTYMGMSLRSPLVASAGPLTGSVDQIRQLEDAGIAAVVLPSLFEEQLSMERRALNHFMTVGTESYAESLTYFPEPTQYRTGPEEYLALIQQAKQAVKVPVIASLNGSTMGGWTEYASSMQQAGADALELNIYAIPTDIDQPGAAVEDTYRDILVAVREAVDIPIAVKLSPFFSNLANVARRLGENGANALVLFNRFYQPDISLEELEVHPHIVLTTEHELRLPLTWIGILYGKLPVDFAASRAIYKGQDALKMIMVGASVTMMTSALIKHGPAHVAAVEGEMIQWMTDHEYASLEQMRGSMSQVNCPDPRAFERAQYIKVLQSYNAVSRG